LPPRLTYVQEYADAKGEVVRRSSREPIDAGPR
jgi:hypothetical protein